MTTQEPSPKRKPLPKFTGMPPMKKLGSSSAATSTHDINEVVVVLPWVPATTRERFPSMRNRPRAWGQRHIRDAAAQHRFRLGVPPGHGVADDHQVRAVAEVSFAETGQYVDADALQEGAHGRVDVLVRAGDPITPLPQQTGQRTGADAADGNEMNVCPGAQVRTHGRNPSMIASCTRGRYSRIAALSGDG